ncbi:MAG: hypothetical protein WC622_13085 [Pedobacter sp.]|jgi:hypothetical protein|uniref:hypothetical protein n=1 Tax=Pedobacter sp. TaxID=1411316 RepID=UPI0035666AB3
MRVFIAFLLLSCFYLSAANALDNKISATVQKSNKQSNLILDKVSELSKKEHNSLQKEPYSEHLNRIHQAIQHPTLGNAIGFINGYLTLVFSPVQSIKKFKGKVNYSYQFIFNCLFPKHTFW